MKTNRRSYVFRWLIVLLVLALNLNCSDDFKDDGPSRFDLIISTEDFSKELNFGTFENGDILGIIRGNSTRGGVDFDLTSQTPTGALAIDTTTGELSIANSLLFEAGGQVTGIVEVRNSGVSEIANVTISIGEAPEICTEPIFNASVWLGNVSVDDLNGDTGIPWDTYNAVALGSLDCDKLIIEGDILGAGCIGDAPQLILTFTPDSPGSTTGTVTAAKQPWSCDDGYGTTYEIAIPSGIYDESTGEILVDYEYFADGEQLFSALNTDFRITPN